VTDWLSLAGGGLLVLLPFLWQNAGYLGVRLNYQNSYTNVMVENRSFAERNTLVDAANAIFADHALTGIGVGAFPLALRERFPDFAFNYQPVHIVLLGVATEIGIFGALFYLIVLVAPWLALWLNRRRLIFSPALIGMSGTLLAITIVGFFDYYTWALAPGRLWQWMVWGLWGAIYQSSFTGAKHA
jgi:O-antigen ligase